MSYLLDTSILVRLANGSDPLHPLAVAALTALFREDEPLYVAPQNLIEFWSVCTRPLEANGGLGLTVEDARSIADVLAAEFLIASDTPEIYPALRQILEAVPVVGKQVHDARLAAVCHVHGIQTVVTFNVRHFARFSHLSPGLRVVEPQQIVEA
jgi:predicted nucleic acid-binding protein